MTKGFAEEQIETYIFIMLAIYYFLNSLNKIPYEYDISVKLHTPVNTSVGGVIYLYQELASKEKKCRLVMRILEILPG